MIPKSYTLFDTPLYIQEESQAMDFVLQKIADKKQIVKIHISLASILEGDTLPNIYLRWCNFLRKHFKEQLPALTLVCQAPCNHAYLSAEIVEFTPVSEVLRVNGQVEGVLYVLLSKNEYQELWTSGLYGGDTQTNVSATIAFEQLKSILEITGFTFDDIVRQWNYIGDILGENAEGGKHLQNYQVFNEVRDLYYKNNKQEQSYPAATGIGMANQGIIIDVIAVKNSARNIPIQSPIQKNAHGYEQNVLVGESLDTHPKKTPLFERARLLGGNDNAELYVSGTASIKGQDTIDKENVLAQAKNTICFIHELCQQNNIKQNFQDFIGKTMEYKRVRVYVKPLQYTLTLEKNIQAMYPTTNINMLTADICRDDLLIEIEADLIYLS
ncbi:MAG: hypothetical protein RRY15_00045 [Bacteroidales bacterium]